MSTQTTSQVPIESANHPVTLDPDALNAIALQISDAINASAALFPFAAQVIRGHDPLGTGVAADHHVYVREDSIYTHFNPPATWGWYEPLSATTEAIGIRPVQSPPCPDNPKIADPFTPPAGSHPLDRPSTTSKPIILSIQASGCVQINGTRSESRLAVILNAILPVLRAAATIHGEIPAPRLVHPPAPSSSFPRVSQDCADALVEKIRPYRWKNFPKLTASIVTKSGLDTAVQHAIKDLDESGAVGASRRLILGQIADFIRRQK